MVASNRTLKRMVRTASPRQLRDDWRSEHGGDYLGHRRAVVAANLFAAGVIGAVALYQTGIMRRMPDPDLPYLDSNDVNASEEAYSVLNMPDSLIAIPSYGMTAALAAAGAKDRHRRHPWLPMATAGKAAIDAAQALALTREQWVRHRKFCIYCLTATAATLASFAASVPEAVAAAKGLARDHRAEPQRRSNYRKDAADAAQRAT